MRSLRYVLIAIVSFMLGSGLTAAADGGLLTEVMTTHLAQCVGAPGYVGMNVDHTTLAICTSDGTVHIIQAK